MDVKRESLHKETRQTGIDPKNIGETENFCATLQKDLLQDVIISPENVVRPLLPEILLQMLIYFSHAYVIRQIL